jgi:hypothetical protein
MALVISDAGSARRFLAEGVEEFPTGVENNLELIIIIIKTSQ